MRGLTKLARPAVLRQNDIAWTANYVAAVTAGVALKPWEKWRHPEIKATLRQELGGKCAYCEGYVEDVAYPHVEHIIPKVVRPDLAHRWRNLTSACGPCNINKGDFYHPRNGLLNPYTHRIDAHLKFLGSLVTFQPGSTRGEVTIGTLDLNRYALAESRAKRLGAVRQVLERWYHAAGQKKVLLEDGLRLDAHDGEFTASVTAYLRSFDFPV